MLKRKLRNTGLAGTVSLLIIAIVSVAATHQFAGIGNRILNDTASRQLYFDTTLLKLNGVAETDAFIIPAISLNKPAAEYTNTYIAQNNVLLKSIREKSAASFRIIDGIFTRYKLPLELKYLAVIESELKSKALSKVGARGVWQLMPETARILSLRVNTVHDERTHLYKSTVAVAKYLRDLYKLYGDWTLVIAAYNCGPGNVYNAIKKSGSRNFWKLQQYLPAETRGHVKKFISTHYYFEGKAGITTLTKDETIAYKKAMIAFVEKQNALFREQQDPADAATKNESEETIAKTTIAGELKLNDNK